jgi:hypothetical protein
LHSSTITILQNNGDGTFSTGEAYGVGANPAAVCTSDLDGDGYLDLIVANRGSDSISVLNNNGNVTFAVPVNYGSFYSPGGVCAADFDGSGKPDLAVGHSNDIIILSNNGDGTFTLPVKYNLLGGGNSSCVTAADFNKDGAPDLALTRWGQQPDAPSNVAILMNNGDGTFATAVYYESWLDPSSVCTADFDGDGSPDLAVTHALGLSTLKNNGDGTFASAIDYTLAYNPRSIVTNDFNLDSIPDLAASNSYAYAVSLLVNNGDGTFADEVNYGVNYYSYSIFADDLFINRSSFPNDANELHQINVPGSIQLNQNYPNPFNPMTTIDYYLSRTSLVTVTIYDILGQPVVTLVNERKASGYYSVVWDGKDKNGRLVASGVYFYHIEAGEFAKSKKMLLLK